MRGFIDEKNNSLGCFGYLWALIIVLGVGGGLAYGVIHISYQRHFDILGEMSKWGATIWNNTDKTGLNSFQVGDPNEKLNQAKEKVSSAIDKGKNTLQEKTEGKQSSTTTSGIPRQLVMEKQLRELTQFKLRSN